MKKVIFINLFIFFFLITLIEATARIFHLADLMGMDENVFLHGAENNTLNLKPNNEGIIFNKKFYTDSYGYRIPNLNFKYDDEKESIFLIGDSTTFGNGVLEEDSFVGLLRKNFQTFNFINTSVPGNNVDHFDKKLGSIDKFNNIIKIIYIYTLNDISKNSELDEINVERKRINRLRDIKIINFINFFFRDKSVFYMWFKGILTDPSARHFKYEYNAYKNKENLIPVENFLNKVKILTDKKNIEFEIVILPYEFQTRGDNCFNEYIDPQLLLVSILKKIPIKFYDYTKYFCENKNPKKLFYKFDPVHLSIDGHRLVFSLLKNNI